MVQATTPSIAQTEISQRTEFIIEPQGKNYALWLDLEECGTPIPIDLLSEIKPLYLLQEEY